MKFPFFKTDKKSKGLLSVDDLKAINQETLFWIKSNEMRLYFDKMSEILLEENEIDFMLLEAIERINRDGIFIVKDFLDPNLADKIVFDIDESLSFYSEKVSSSLFYEDDVALIQKESAKLNGYHNISKYEKAVFNIRSGADKGMIDIFNADYLFDGEGFDFVRENSFINKFLASLPHPLKQKNLNIYVNKSIENTRGFHVDSYTPQLKIFIYLTDVVDLSSGPYTYVRGSHLDTPYRKINKLLSSSFDKKTETPIFSYSDIYPILGKKGTLVVSYQSGSHRGFPQSKNAERKVLTINCM